MTSCSINTPIKSNTATILIKTPNMKYYDKGFISKYSNYTEVQILSAGSAVLELKIYKDKICKDFLSCQTFNTFNKNFLHASYDDFFIKELFEKDDKEIIHRDKENGILIKILKD